ncbi:MAG: pantetheine-phosphate adenylyltransferase [Bacteroidetes bacterium QS_7_67_15]|nr:MAG: pantetheine-phosphate adenylyltransferase [Bacteroidetes bacterium QS_7_67_15]
MPLVLYPGTFDPFTYGHLDVLERTLRLFDEVEVTVAVNTSKDTLFDAEERVALARECAEHLGDGVEGARFRGLLVDRAKERGAVALVRGLRQVSDFDYEFRMAFANRKLAPEVETIFLTPSEEHTFVSSTVVRDVHRWDGDVSKFVPPPVVEAMRRKRAAERG